MDRVIVAHKLDSLRRCLERVRSRCPDDVQTLATNVDLQDIVVLNLSRAVQLCVDVALHVAAQSSGAIPDSMGQAFAQLADQGQLDEALASRLRKAVGFRNIAVHNYRAVDWDIVHAIATKHLGDFEAFAKAIVLTTSPPP